MKLVTRHRGRRGRPGRQAARPASPAAATGDGRRGTAARSGDYGRPPRTRRESTRRRARTPSRSGHRARPSGRARRHAAASAAAWPARRTGRRRGRWRTGRCRPGRRAGALPGQQRQEVARASAAQASGPACDVGVHAARAGAARRSSRSKRKRSSRRTVNSEAWRRRAAPVGRGRVDEGVVGDDLQGRRSVPLGQVRVPCTRTSRVGQRDAGSGSKRTSQPVAACRPSSAGWLEALVELVELAGVEQDPHRPDVAAGEDLRVERRSRPGSPWPVVSAVHDLARRRSARCAATAGSGDALGAGAELRGGAVPRRASARPPPGTAAARGERDRR